MKETARTTRGWTTPMRRGAAALLVLLAYAAAGLSQVLPEDPEGKVVADVIPQLPPDHLTQTDKIMSLIGTRPGMKYSRAAVDQDVRKLFETRLFRDVRVRPVLTTDDKVIVYFIFDEHTGVVKDIIYKGGQHLKRDELDQLTGLRKGAAMNPAANKMACQAIKDRLREKGRLMAECYLEEGDKRSDTRVIFNICEGPVTRVSAIEFTGNHFVNSARLKTQVEASAQFLHLLGGTYNPAVVENDVIKLRDYYRDFGYHDVQVRREVQWENDLKHVRIIYHIVEGQRYHVASVGLVGPQVMKEDELLRLVGMKSGDVYSKDQVNKDMGQIRDYYGFRGYLVAPDPKYYYPQDRPGQVDVRYEWEERPPDIVGEVKIYGNTVTRDRVIRRQIPVYPGQVLSYPDLRIAENNLAKLQIFEFKPDQGIKPTVTVDPASEGQVKDIDVHVTETPTGSLMFGLGVNSNSGLTGSIVLNEKNFDILRPPTSIEDLLSGRALRGAGQEFRIEAMPGTVFQRYTASWREPFLFDSPYSLGVSGYYYTRIFNEYTEARVGSQISLGRQFTPQWSGSVGLRIEGVRADNVPFYAPIDFQEVTGRTNFLLGMQAGVKRDTRDSYLRPTQGNVLSLSFEQVTGDFNFPVASVDESQYWTTYQRADGSGRHVLALRSRVAVNGSHAPVFERQYAGGFQTIRGFQFRGVGPNDLGFMVGGDFLLLNSLEYQIPVRANDQLYFVGFIDSGTVERSVGIKDYRVSAGVGVRIAVPMLGPMPIALDLAFPLNKTSTDREQVFNFWMGYFH